MGKKTIYVNSQIPNSTKELADLGLLEIAETQSEFEEKLNYIMNKNKTDINWKKIEKNYCNPAKKASNIILKLLGKI